VGLHSKPSRLPGVTFENLPLDLVGSSPAVVALKQHGGMIPRTFHQGAIISCSIQGSNHFKGPINYPISLRLFFHSGEMGEKWARNV